MQKNNGYQMIIHTNGSGVGHFTVELRDESGEKVYRGPG